MLLELYVGEFTLNTNVLNCSNAQYLCWRRASTRRPTCGQQWQDDEGDDDSTCGSSDVTCGASDLELAADLWSDEFNSDVTVPDDSEPFFDIEW